MGSSRKVRSSARAHGARIDGLLLALLLLLLVACGGRGASRAAESPAPPRVDTAVSAPAEARANVATERTSKPARVSCEDGTCSACGEGICPAGFYCDENAVGGAACSWLKECAAKPSCACVARVLGAGCECESANGALRVRCGS